MTHSGHPQTATSFRETVHRAQLPPEANHDGVSERGKSVLSRRARELP
jgi:hypothetical protein